MITLSRLVSVGVLLALALVIALNMVFNTGMASDRMSIISIPVVILIIPFSIWLFTLGAKKANKTVGLIFLLILLIVTSFWGAVSIWAFQGRNSGWISLWPDDIVGQVGGYIIMFLPVLASVIFVIYVKNTLKNKRRS